MLLKSIFPKWNLSSFQNVLGLIWIQFNDHFSRCFLRDYNSFFVGCFPNFAFEYTVLTDTIGGKIHLFNSLKIVFTVCKL